MEERSIGAELVDSSRCQHLYLRGNFRQDMFFDKDDMINVWNRLWLSAAATEVQILSAVILDNHLHICALLQDDEQRTRFKRYFRMSITQYHNRRYHVSGTLGMRKFKHAVLRDVDDLKDCICYHIRNVLHHNVERNFWKYPYSTANDVFGMKEVNKPGFYTRETVPEKLLNDYLPIREELPQNWKMSVDGMIVPPSEVFRSDLVETLFGNSRDQYIETLSHRTLREFNDIDELCAFTVQLRKDEQVIEFVKYNLTVPIPSMTMEQKMEAISLVNNRLKGVSPKIYARVFGIPYSTLLYKLKKGHL